MKKVLAMVVMGIGAAFLSVREARACSIPVPVPHELDPAARERDRTPPVLAAPLVVELRRGPSPQQGCTGGQSTSCDGVGAISLTPTVTDDQTPLAQMGFRLSVVAGTLPRGLTLPATDVRALSERLYFHWDDGTEGQHEGFSFTLEVAAVDLGGNLSAPVQVTISDGGDGGGCSVADRRPGRPYLPSPFALLVLAFGSGLSFRRGKISRVLRWLGSDEAPRDVDGVSGRPAAAGLRGQRRAP